MSEDPYKVLGLNKSATDDEIRSAYRKKAKALHPDLNPGDKAAEEKFKKVTAAFNILGDPDTRKRFDLGEVDADGQERPEAKFYREFAGGRGAGGFDDASSFSDIFGDLFGHGKHGGFDARGEDLRYTLDVEFMEAAVGAKKRIKLPDGGALDMNVPSGVVDGQVLRLKGKGQPGVGGGPKGDALIEISVKSHEYFTRDGDNVLLDLPITVYEAILGGKVEAPTLTGRVTLTIPRGSNTGKLLRLRGKGVVNSRTKQTGDQLVSLKIVAPEEIDETLESAMEEWRENYSYDPRKKL